jgi:hypothetical protein
MSNWFFMVGEPLAEAEREQVQNYLLGLGIRDALSIDSVLDWSGVRDLIDRPDWDRRWWEAEQVERQRLYARAVATRGESAARDALSSELTRASDEVHGAAAVEAARGGCSDPGLIRAAAGAASESLYLATLARLAGESNAHSFALKRSLFAGGHWPLGIVDQHYYVF